MLAKSIYKIMNKFDLKNALSWAAKEGRNPGKYEHDPLYAVDPRGYWQVEVDNEPVAFLSGIKFSKDYSFLGLHMVKEQYRERGYDRQLWNVAMEHLKDCRFSGMNVKPNDVEYYSEFGFHPRGLNNRWVGIPSAKFISDVLNNTDVRLKGDVHPTQLMEYDANIFWVDRKRFMEKLLSMPETNIRTAFVQDKVSGYGVITPSVDGFKIALCADNQPVAETLFAGLCQSVNSDAQIQIDSPQSNLSSTKLAEKFGLFKSSVTTQLGRGQAPLIDNGRIYGIPSLEMS